MALISTRSGCKVGWDTYDDEAEAQAASARAREQAVKLARQGYDFGYQMPGYVTKAPDKDEWTVVVP